MNGENTNRNRSDSMPHVTWLEGVLDYFNAPFPQEPGDSREIGFGIGRQIVGLYLVEMLLKYALDDLEIKYERSHNLLGLFAGLPERRQSAVETKYKDFLFDGVAETWDFASSVASFLKYLGDDPMSDSRYFWERQHSPNKSIIFFGSLLRLLIYACFIVLHDYPEGSSLEKRYETRFISLEDLEEQEIDDQSGASAATSELANRRITANISWLEGLLAYFRLPFPHESEDPRSLGFQVGQRVIGLFLTEMLLKYALDDCRRGFSRNHNLHRLFKNLPCPRRRAVERKYKEILYYGVSWTWDFARSADSLLQTSGGNPITETRYFWEQSGSGVVHLSPGPLIPLVYALLIELHNYPQAGRLIRRYDTTFVPFEEAQRFSKDYH